MGSRVINKTVYEEKLIATHCYYCERPFGVDDLGNTMEASIDHFIPVFYGGSDNKENLLICCSQCNQLKANLLPNEFLYFLGCQLRTGNPLKRGKQIFSIEVLESIYRNLKYKIENHKECIRYDSCYHKYACPILGICVFSHRLIKENKEATHLIRKSKSLAEVVKVFEDFTDRRMILPTDSHKGFKIVRPRVREKKESKLERGEIITVPEKPVSLSMDPLSLKMKADREKKKPKSSKPPPVTTRKEELIYEEGYFPAPYKHINFHYED